MPTRKPNAGFLKKEPSETHKAVAEYVTKTTGHAVSAGDVALVQRLYPLYLKSDEVVKAREAAEQQRREAEEKKRKEKEDRLKARLREAEERAAKLRRELGLDTDDETVPPVAESSIDEDEEPADEPAVLTLSTDEPADEFVETSDEDDDDDWGDLDEDVEDF